MRPEQVIDCQADLYQRLQPGTGFANYILEVLRQGQMTTDLTPTEMEANSQGMRAKMAQAVHMASAYRVTEDMSMLVQHAASTLDDSDRFMADLAPSEHGIVFFERPLPIIDARGRLMLAHWLVWGRATAESRMDEHGRLLPGYQEVPASVSFWMNDILLERDEITTQILAEHSLDSVYAQTGRWGFIGGDIVPNGAEVGAPMADIDDKKRAEILADGHTPTEFTNTRRYLLALWWLLGQSVTIAEDEWVRRTAFKRAQRLGLPARVTVIRLRRTEGSRHEGESLVDWSHRWLVRGHPRWQPYGPHTADHAHVLGPVEVQAGHSVRRCQVSGCEHHVARIWIAPYVKGPEGKPLRFTEHVYDLAR